MTRIYENPVAPAAGEARTRALVIGAGRYPNAKTKGTKVPVLEDLTSVGPSVRAFVTKLLSEWRTELSTPLGSLDLLLSETVAPGGSKWNALGIGGEPPGETAIDPPTLQEVKTALANCLANSATQDHFLFLCCGHGFWKSHSYFVLSDFGATPQNPWPNVIDLDDFRLGLSQEVPRNQWLFFDCCKDIPAKILSALGNIGDPLIQATAEEITAANKRGALSQFGMSSATPGEKAFGIPGKPSRFCEMLIEAIDGGGAVAKHGPKWWVNERGIGDAVQNYTKRYPDLDDPDFYKFATPISNDMPDRMLFRSIAGEPKSRFVAYSKPRPALKNASVAFVHDVGQPQPVENPHGRAKLLIELPARKSVKVIATFQGGSRKEVDVFAALPLAEPGDQEFIA